MSQRVYFRKCKPEEVEKVKAYFKAKYPWASEPEYLDTWIRLEDDEVTGMLEFRLRAVVSICDATSPTVMAEMIGRADQTMANMGYPQYEFHVREDNTGFRKIAEDRFGLEPRNEELLIYFVRREKQNANTKHAG